MPQKCAVFSALIVITAEVAVLHAEIVVPAEGDDAFK